MSIPFKQPPPRPDIPWIDTDDGRPELFIAQYFTALDTLVRQLAAGQVGTLTDAANDTAAAAAGVQVGQMYKTGSALKVRVV
jgi:hypothetical protein